MVNKYFVNNEGVIKPVVTEVTPTALEGGIYYNALTHKMMFHDGTDWVELGGVAPSGGEIPVFPVTPIEPFVYLLDDSMIWQFYPEFNLWKRLDVVVGQPLQIKKLTNNNADAFLPVDYPANTLKAENHGLPIEMFVARPKTYKFLDGYNRKKATMVGTKTQLEFQNAGGGVAGDYIKVTFADEDAVSYIADDINLSGTDRFGMYGDNQPNDVIVRIADSLGVSYQTIARLTGWPPNDFRIILGNTLGIAHYGDGCYIKVEYGTSDTNGDILDKIGFTNGQEVSGTTSSEPVYIPKGSGFKPKQQMRRACLASGILREGIEFPEHSWWTGTTRPRRAARFSLWARDKNNNVKYFNMSNDMLIATRPEYVNQYGKFNIRKAK